MLSWMMWATLACGPPEADPAASDTPIGADTDTDTTSPEPLAPCSAAAPEVVPALSVSERACAGGVTDCAAEGPYIDGTCCAEGPTMVEVGTGHGAEIVDLEVRDGLAVSCGGFGENILDISDPTQAIRIGGVTRRCQRAAFGATLPSGDRIVYLAHHGDSWVRSPTLTTAAVSPTGSVETLDILADYEILFEGLAYRDGLLYVAAHASGVLIFDVSDGGVPEQVGSLGGFDNASKLAVDGERLFALDNTTLRAFSLADPSTPTPDGTVGLERSGYDVAAGGGRVYVALGSSGVQSFDAETLAPLAEAPSVGSAQAVDVEGDVVAVAAWNHVQLRRADDLALIGTKKTRPPDEFEQDLGVALDGGRLFVGEWEGVHVLEPQPGHVSADIWLGTESVSFWGDEPGACALEITNRGALPLEISGLATDSPTVTVSGELASIAPGAVGQVTLAYTPPTGATRHVLSIASNDPDAEQSPLNMPVYTSTSTRLDVGDRLTDGFAFLDQEEGSLENLEGHVIVLAYFALF